MIPPFSTTASAPVRTMSASSMAVPKALSMINLHSIFSFSNYCTILYPSHVGLDSQTITWNFTPLFAPCIKISATDVLYPYTKIVFFKLYY